MSVPAEDQIKFLQNMQRILEEGSFTSSYKYALLLSLADLAVENGDDSGAALPVALDNIAEKFIRYYWRQARPYPLARGGAEVLLQNNEKQAAIITLVGAHLHLTVSQLQRDPAKWTRLRNQTRGVIREMPLKRLQRVGNRQIEFLYAYPPTNGQIVLKPGVAFCLRRFHGLIYDLVTAAWLRFVRKQNQGRLGQANDLSEFLFGTDRSNLGVLRPVLRKIQDERCFYCRARLDEPGDVDHFIPWARYPVDLGHNFVLADAACNNKKRDRLAAVPHLERWALRNTDHTALLAEQFERNKIIHDEATSLGVARWAYSQAADAQALAWDRGSVLVPIAPNWSQVVGI